MCIQYLMNLIGEAIMLHTRIGDSAREMLDRVADYISKSGITLSCWVLSIVFIMGRILIGPF